MSLSDPSIGVTPITPITPSIPSTPKTPLLRADRDSAPAHLLLSPSPHDDALDNINPLDSEPHCMLRPQCLDEEAGAPELRLEPGTLMLDESIAAFDAFYLPTSVCVRHLGAASAAPPAPAAEAAEAAEAEPQRGAGDGRVQRGVNGVGDTVHFVEEAAAALGASDIESPMCVCESDAGIGGALALAALQTHPLHPADALSSAHAPRHGDGIGDILAPAALFKMTAPGIEIETSPTSVMTNAAVPPMPLQPPEPRKGSRDGKEAVASLRQASAAKSAKPPSTRRGRKRTREPRGKSAAARATDACNGDPPADAAVQLEAYVRLVGPVGARDAQVDAEHDRVLRRANDEAEERKKKERIRLRTEPRGPGAPNQCASRMEARLSRFRKDAYIVALQHAVRHLVRDLCVYRRVAQKHALAERVAGGPGVECELKTQLPSMARLEGSRDKKKKQRRGEMLER